jgi:hypothetical protein
VRYVPIRSTKNSDARPEPTTTNIRKAFAAPLKEMQTLTRRMKQSYPASDATALAKKYVE